MNLRSATLALAVCGLAACGWDTAQESFPTYKEFLGSKFIGSEWLPAGLVPRSATDIRIDVDFDFKEVEIEFQARPDDLQAVAAGFAPSPTAARKQLLEARGFNLRVEAADELRARCGGDRVEFLALERGGQVRYWRTNHPALMALACPAATSPAS